MYKLVLLFVILFATQNDVNANTKENPKEKENEELCDWEYWNAFSQTFNQTADYKEAESAALEAKSEAKDKTGLEEWLKENSPEEPKTCS